MIARPEYPVFIDWITVQQFHPQGGIKQVNNGRVFAVDEDGLVEWDVQRAFEFEGSHDSRVQIQSDGWSVKLSGNVGRIHRPDNIFGFALDGVMEKANRIPGACALWFHFLCLGGAHASCKYIINSAMLTACRYQLAKRLQLDSTSTNFVEAHNDAGVGVPMVSRTRLVA